MSLWTPGGEHEVPRDQQPGQQGGPQQTGQGQPPVPGEIDPDDLTDEQRAELESMAQEMAQVRQQLLQVPASTVVANHAMGLYELAAIHLSHQPPNLAEGRVAIDAMAGVVENLAGRLGENEPVLTDALAQLRLAYVQLQQGPAAAADDGDGDGDGAES